VSRDAACKPDQGPRWVHEIKFDGYRLQVRTERGRICLTTRGGHDWTSKFRARLVEALKQLTVTSAMLDGELVVEAEGGVSDFSALQADLSEGSTDRFVLYPFDIMYLDGFDIRRVPLIERKHMVHSLLAPAPRRGPVRYSEHLSRLSHVLIADRGDRAVRAGDFHEKAQHPAVLKMRLAPPLVSELELTVATSHHRQPAARARRRLARNRKKRFRLHPGEERVERRRPIVPPGELGGADAEALDPRPKNGRTEHVDVVDGGP
jgi:hypothetical protein